MIFYQTIPMELTNTTQYDALPEQIGQLLSQGRRRAVNVVQQLQLHTFWQIGRHIVEFEQAGQERAEYGSHLLDRLSKDLTLRYGKSFSRSNLVYIRKLYLVFPISQTLSDLLTWSHYVEILRSENELERGFYIKQCEQENWGVRELKRQIKSSLFHRLALSKYKEGILQLVVFIEYALSSIQNPIFVSRYELYLPNKQQLEAEIRRLL